MEHGSKGEINNPTVNLAASYFMNLDLLALFLSQFIQH